MLRCFVFLHSRFTLAYGVVIVLNWCRVCKEAVVILQRANMEFTQAKAGNQSASSRETKLKDMATAYDSFVELKSNIDEGTKVRLEF